MAFALVQLTPFSVLSTFPTVPLFIRWPDGAMSHGVDETGAAWQSWAFVPMTQTGTVPPTEFYNSSGYGYALNGTAVVETQNWTPWALSDVKAVLANRLRNAAKSNVVSPTDEPAEVRGERIEQARAAIATTVIALGDYPLLDVLVGSSQGATVREVATTVLATWSTLMRRAAATDGKLRVGLRNIAVATTADAAIAAYTGALP